MSLIEQLRSWRHGFWFALSRRLRWSRGTHREKPALQLHLDAQQAECVVRLQQRFDVHFERSLGEKSSTINYEYLDLLDRAWSRWHLAPPQGGVLCDAGCASFWYASALQAFFQPARMVGVEVEGHRLFRDGRARIDYASGYLADLPNAEFVVADYARLELPADVITSWFPFVTRSAILAWRLPLSLLRPQAFFAQVKHNLKRDGTFFMVSHGRAEAELAAGYCGAAGLVSCGQFTHDGALSRYRLAPPVASCWRHA